jgi:opacity protein-like surface antigen
VKTTFDFGIFNLYVGGGLSYFRYKETSPIGEIQENKWGWLIRAGTYVDLSYFLFLDLQATYIYTQVNTEDLEVNLGGFSLGAGLGLRF